MALLSRPKETFLNLFVHRCAGCGSRITTDNTDFCSWCLVRMYPDGVRMAGTTEVFTGFFHSGVVREMVLRLKFGGERYLAGKLAKLALGSWEKIPEKGDFVFPVPASRSRFRSRGYNQAALLARSICKETGATLKSPIVRHDGQSQIKVSGVGRSKNIKGKFSISSKKVSYDGKIWLIDDVMTTGATITEILSVLSNGGIQQVQPAVICFRKISKMEVNHAGTGF